MNRKCEYAALVAERKRCHLCTGLRNPADPELPALDSDQIGPWSRLCGDLDATLMVIGQDWGDVHYYIKNRGLDDVRNRTTRTLEELLLGIGLKVALSETGRANRGVFLTNALLCLKAGGMQAPVEQQWFTNCANRFLRRQIEIVAPRVVVCLGQKAYEAVLNAFRLESLAFRRAVEAESGIILPNQSRLLAVYHCGQRILNTHRSLDQQRRDWHRVAKALALESSAG